MLMAHITPASWTGHPFGSESFVEKILTLLGRDLRKQKPGRKPKEG